MSARLCTTISSYKAGFQKRGTFKDKSHKQGLLLHDCFRPVSNGASAATQGEVVKTSAYDTTVAFIMRISSRKHVIFPRGRERMGRFIWRKGISRTAFNPKVIISFKFLFGRCHTTGCIALCVCFCLDLFFAGNALRRRRSVLSWADSELHSLCISFFFPLLFLLRLHFVHCFCNKNRKQSKAFGWGGKPERRFIRATFVYLFLFPLTFLSFLLGVSWTNSKKTWGRADELGD